MGPESWSPRLISLLCEAPPKTKRSKVTSFIGSPLEAGGEDIYKENFSGNVALIVGGEDSGVKRLTKEKCDKILSIPLQGKVNSLNASVALGIAVYEVVRNRL